jgi:hypothetical protein
MRKLCLGFFLFLIGMSFVPRVSYAKTTHADRISAYEGTKTCLACHRQAAKDVAASLHYQQQGAVPYVKDWPAGKNAGMMVSY